jgi:hypothetical protein
MQGALPTHTKLLESAKSPLSAANPIAASMNAAAPKARLSSTALRQTARAKNPLSKPASLKTPLDLEKRAAQAVRQTSQREAKNAARRAQGFVVDTVAPAPAKIP